MAKIRGLENDTLSEAPGSPGISRHLAFKGDDFLVVRSRVDPGVVSGWHHHGDYDVYGYVVRGSVSFEGWKGCYFGWLRRFLPCPSAYSASRCQSVWHRGARGNSVSQRERPDRRQCGGPRPRLAP
jgi:hypothetical protein